VLALLLLLLLLLQLLFVPVSVPTYSCWTNYILLLFYFGSKMNAHNLVVVNVGDQVLVGNGRMPAQVFNLPDGFPGWIEVMWDGDGTISIVRLADVTFPETAQFGNIQIGIVGAVHFPNNQDDDEEEEEAIDVGPALFANIQDDDEEEEAIDVGPALFANIQDNDEPDEEAIDAGPALFANIQDNDEPEEEAVSFADIQDDQEEDPMLENRGTNGGKVGFECCCGLLKWK